MVVDEPVADTIDMIVFIVGFIVAMLIVNWMIDAGIITIHEQPCSSLKPDVSNTWIPYVVTIILFVFLTVSLQQLTKKVRRR